MVTAMVEVIVDLEAFETKELIDELKARGYSVDEEQDNPTTEIIETDIRGCEIRANGDIYIRGGILKITVERE